MDPITGAALITGGASLFGNLFGGMFSSSGQQSANQTNLKLAREAMQYNKQMWDLENEYNSPKNQMARYRDAGLNPNLMYGAVSSGNSNNVPQLDSVRVENANEGFARGLSSGITSAIDAYYGAYNLDSDITLKKAQANKLDAEAEYIRNSKTNNTNAQTTLFGEQTFASRVRSQYDLIRTAREKFGHEMEQALQGVTIAIEYQKLYNLEAQEKNIISEITARDVDNLLKKAHISKLEFDKMLSRMQYDLDKEIKRGGLSLQTRQTILSEQKELQRIKEWSREHMLQQKKHNWNERKGILDTKVNVGKSLLNFVKFW